MKNLLHPTKISIEEKVRIELITSLNNALACTNDMYAQLKQAHWNIKGPQFIALHKLFDEIAEELEEHIDTLAERITALGGTTLATIQETAKLSSLRAYPVDIFSATEHLAHLTHNIAILGELIRNYADSSAEFDDMATNDIYVSLLRFLDKNLWFLESHLQK